MVDALATESDAQAREALLNALLELASSDLAKTTDVKRALDLPRTDNDAPTAYWADLGVAFQRSSR